MVDTSYVLFGVDTKDGSSVVQAYAVPHIPCTSTYTFWVYVCSIDFLHFTGAKLEIAESICYRFNYFLPLWDTNKQWCVG